MVAKICIISINPLWHAPRVVKEADALSEAGYSVLVVVPQYSMSVTKWDNEIASQKRWQFKAVETWRHKVRTLYRKIFLRLIQRLVPVGWSNFLEIQLRHEYSSNLKKLMIMFCPDLIIAHTPLGLSIALKASEEIGCKLAFDAEDDHVGEFSNELSNSRGALAVKQLQQMALPKCVYISAPSSEIVKILKVENFLREEPMVIRNVFSILQQNSFSILQNRVTRGVSFYWFSQFVGLDRGLQDAFFAAAQLRGDFHINIRGILRPEVSRTLFELLERLKLIDRVTFLPPVDPETLNLVSQEHDVGLALEQPVNRNKLYTVSNKFYFYCSCGLAVIATRTPGQESAYLENPNIGNLYSPGNISELASIMQKFISDPRYLKITKANALDAAATKWNWEQEGEKLISKVSKVLRAP